MMVKIASDAGGSPRTLPQRDCPLWPRQLTQKTVQGHRSPLDHSPLEVVVTGIGLLSPIGIGREAFWTALCRGQSGVGLIRSFDASGLPVALAAEVRDFDPKQYVANRKQLKVMCRDAQLGVAAARTGLSRRRH